VQTATEGERLGYASMWTSQHHFASDASYRPFDLAEDEWPTTDYDLVPDALTMLAHVAGRTETIRLGSAVSVPHWDNPMLLAERAAIVDVVSGGRLDLALGRGVGFREYEVFDVPQDEGVNTRKFREAVELMRTAWESEEFTFAGEFFKLPRLHMLPRPIQEKLPAFIGAASVGSARWAAELGWPYATITWPLTDFDAYKEKMTAFRETYREAWPDSPVPDVPHVFYTYCAETDAEAAEATYRRMCEFQYIVENHYEKARGRFIGGTSAQANDLERVGQLARFPVENHIVGSPETCIERIRHLQSELGLEYIVCNVGFGNMPQEDVLASMELFSEQVMPSFSYATS
jgi:alkanesulfonate monooxygenase SsuD/methylene tetrahydromethanopterin reductase-like flavin-dependent oxidoreductase (luciferase family)